MNVGVERAESTDRDLAAIFDFLIASYLSFGDDEQEAIERAATRLRMIEREMLAIGRAPQQGTLRDDLLPGLRCVTRKRAVFYFEVNDAIRRVRILAIFLAGQDQQRRMLLRLFSEQ